MDLLRPHQAMQGLSLSEKHIFALLSLPKAAQLRSLFVLSRQIETEPHAASARLQKLQTI